MTIDESRIPILVAGGQVTDRDKSGSGQVPVELMAAACRAAQEDAACQRLLADVGHMAATGLTVDADQVKTPISRGYKNLPKTVANLLGISPRHYFYVATGGNTPQYLVNHFAEKISLGEAQTVLLTGGESLATMLAKFNPWYKWLLPKPGWRDDPGGRPTPLGDSRPSSTSHEAKHGLELPANVYPLFENALQHHYGRNVETHRAAIGALFANLSEVAARNPYAWFQQARTADELIDVSAQNRMVAFPYTKNLNSMIAVNQAAAVVLTSVARARALGIPENRWVYLHGCADANDIWNVTERINYHSSPAMARCAREALQMAGKTIDQIQHFDIYSCFPSAVQIACDEFGLAHSGETQLTQTGGLPYFGGPGNNHSMHGIVEMLKALRTNAGEFGLLNANGWFLTKHSLGVYSTEPWSGHWRRENPANYQAELSELSGPEVEESPAGEAHIETFTVLFDRKQEATSGIVIGRTSQNKRFVANTPKDPQMLAALCAGDAIGRTGRVQNKAGKNTFYLD